jgi:hypothetical protein
MSTGKKDLIYGKIVEVRDWEWKREERNKSSIEFGARTPLLCNCNTAQVILNTINLRLQ